MGVCQTERDAHNAAVASKWLDFDGDPAQCGAMEGIVVKPKKLRPEIIQRIQAMDEENLLLLHRVLLRMEKERLWRELSAEAEADRHSGRFDKLTDVIREARAELHQR